MLERQHGLDQAGDAGGGVEVADVGLDRAEAQKPTSSAGGAEHLGQRRDLDRVAERRAGAVRLDVADASRGSTPATACAVAIDLGLAVDARRGEADLAGAVVVDRRSRGSPRGSCRRRPARRPAASAPRRRRPLPATVPRASASKARQWPSGDRIIAFLVEVARRSREGRATRRRPAPCRIRCRSRLRQARWTATSEVEQAVWTVTLGPRRSACRTPASAGSPCRCRA